MSSAARWTIVVVIAVVGLVAALLSSLGSGGQPAGPSHDDAAARNSQAATAPGAGSEVSNADRAAAGLPACLPAAAGAAGATTAAAGTPATDTSVAGVRVGCMADGSEVSLDQVQSGTPMLLNLWAYWCEPCRRELPALRDAQAELGNGTRIVLAHVDPNEGSGLQLLQQLGVNTLPSVSDPQEQLPLHFRAPPVLPVSVLVRADGTVAKVLPQPLQSKEDVVDVVNKYLGEGPQK